MMKRFSACMLLVAMLSACNSDSRQLLVQAEARWREGYYEDAIRLNTLLYHRDRSGSYAKRALLNIGNIYYLDLRQIKDAIDTYKKLVEEFPGTAEERSARTQLAAIYANEIGDMTQAISEYDRLLESVGGDERLELEFRRASGYLATGEIDRALRELRRLEEAGVAGHLADQVSLKIGNIYQIRRRYEDALAYFQRVSTAPCADCRRRANIHLMESYEALYQYERAIEAIQKLDRTPESERLVSREVERLSEKMRRMNTKPLPSWERTRHR